ncbi:MAG: EF-hand domain-containing protein, partial [Planctomycetaceae bacterium]|nr:EF-hand domain-containing protein [Planctomycetaceae bacterium]
LEFADLSGKRHHLGEFVKQRGLLVAVTSTSCPISKKYLPTLVQLAQEYSAQGFGVVLVNPTATDKPAAIQAAADALGSNGVYVHDAQGELCRALQATSTTDVLLIDSARSVRYHGAIDDQYGFGYSLAAPRTTYLSTAIAEYLHGESIAITATEAPGCRLDLQPLETTDASVTYHNRISRIVQSNCLECHHDGGVAPFSLETRDDLIAHAAMITSVLERGVMPPWFATPGAEGKPSPWLNDGALTPDDKRDLLAWLAGDHAEGDPRDAPLPMQFASGWTIGTPDLVAQFPEPISIQATGVMGYQHVVVDIDVPEDKWVERIEIKPSAPEVVHHVLVFAMPPDEGGGDRRRGPEDGISYWGIYVPGNSRRIYPHGFARKLPQGSRLHFQMHYTPNGTATEDRTRIAFVFADQEPEHEVKTASLVNSWFEIPPGDANFTDSAKIRLPADVTVLGYLPHMHLRGKACNYEAILPDGNRETLLDIPRYDFNWQLLYRLAEPRTFPKGTTLKFNATFDNSAGNPANPDPEATVRWGEQTYDEMIVGYLEYYLPAGADSSAGDNPFGLAVDRDQMLFTSLDSNDDGQLTLEELQQLSKNPRMKVTPEIAAVVFATLDKDQDGYLAVDEFRALRDLLRKKR